MTADRLAAKHSAHLRCQRLWGRAMTARRRGVPVLPALLRRTLRSIYGADLPLWDRRPDDLYLMHNGLGVVIHPDTRFTGPTIVFHHVTFGNAWTPENEGTPTVGRYVFVGAGAKLLGNIHVGDFCVIGANAVVTRDVPSGHLAVGNPATIKPLDPVSMLATCFDIEPAEAASIVG